MLAAFAPLLEPPQQLVERMAPCGAPPALGDGLLALPTLVHRGPGCEEPESGEERQVLFFTLAPVFSGRQASATARSLGAYNPDAQIHAAWMLWRTGDALPPGRREAVLEAYSNPTPTPTPTPLHPYP